MSDEIYGDDAPAPDGFEIMALGPDGYRRALPALAALLVDAVENGASVNFLAGLTLAEATEWWAARTSLVEDGTITPVVARRTTDDALVGSAILIRSRNPNGPHRAEVGKVLVRSDVRRRGLGRALMRAIESVALRDGRWLLVLDTHAGTAADELYRSLGWTVLGTMPDHSYRTDGVLAPTTFFWKDLRVAAPGDRFA